MVGDSSDKYSGSSCGTELDSIAYHAMCTPSLDEGCGTEEERERPEDEAAIVHRVRRKYTQLSDHDGVLAHSTRHPFELEPSTQRRLWSRHR